MDIIPKYIKNDLQFLCFCLRITPTKIYIVYETKIKFIYKKIILHISQLLYFGFSSII